MKKSKKMSAESTQEVKESNSRPLTEEQFEHTKMAIEGGLEMKTLTEEEATQLKGIVEGLKGKDNMAVVTIIACMLPLLKFTEIIAVTKMMEDTAKSMYMQELMEKISGM